MALACPAEEFQRVLEIKGRRSGGPVGFERRNRQVVPIRGDDDAGTTASIIDARLAAERAPCLAL